MFTAAYWSWCICDSHREWEAECQAVYPQGTQRYLLAWGLADACQKKASAQQISLGNAMHDVSKRQRSVVKKGRRCSSYWLTRAAFRIWFWSTYSNSILGDGSAFREDAFKNNRLQLGYAPRGIPAAWSKRLTVTEPGLCLMLNYVMEAQIRKAAGCKTQLDKEGLKKRWRCPRSSSLWQKNFKSKLQWKKKIWTVLLSLREAAETETPVLSNPLQRHGHPGAGSWHWPKRFRRAYRSSTWIPKVTFTLEGRCQGPGAQKPKLEPSAVQAFGGREGPQRHGHHHPLPNMPACA